MALGLGTASRFSVLRIEDDEETSINTQPKPSTTTSNRNPKQDENKKKQITKKKKPERKGGIDPELQSLAFGKVKSKKLSTLCQQNSHPNKSKKSVAVTPNLQQNIEIDDNLDEEQLKKNEEVASRLYEKDLEQAIMLSKIDFEEKRELYESFEREAKDVNSAINTTAAKKKKKIKKEKQVVMTLGEFNNLSPSASNVVQTPEHNETAVMHEAKPINSSDGNFFEEVIQDAKKIINKEYNIEQLMKKEPHISIDVRLLQFQDMLEKKDEEIEELKRERHKLMTDNSDLTKMNSKLCAILSSGQSKKQLDACMLVDELNKEKDELALEVANLHAALEQEKSKVHILQQQLLRVQSSRKDSK